MRMILRSWWRYFVILRGCFVSFVLQQLSVPSDPLQPH